MSRSGAVLAISTLALSGACGESKPRFTEPMVLGGVEVSAEVLNQGAKVYQMRCATCHHHDGSGNGPGGRALKEKPRDFRAANFEYRSGSGDSGLPTDEELGRTIKNGRIEEGMPAWPTLTDEDLHAVIQYIKTFSPKWREAGGAEA